MSWVWLLTGAVVLVALLAAARWVRLFLFAFSLSAGALLVLHMRTDPAEGGAALAAMGGGLVLAGPVRRLLTRGLI